MSSELENLRQLVTKLDEVQIDLETVKEGLDKNFENYKNISDISSDISEKNQGVLESINTLQIQATETVETAIKKATDLKEEMSKYYSSENTKIKKNFDALMFDIQNELSTLKSTIATTIQDAVRNVNIDTSDLSKVVNEKIAKYDLSKLDHFIKNSNSNIDTAIKQMAQSMTQVERIDGILKGSISSLDQTADKISTSTENINDAVGNINSVNKSVTMAMTLAMLFVGVIIGAGVMTYLKIDAVSNYYFSSYEKEIKNQKEINIALMDQIDEASSLEQWLVNNKIKINFGQLENTKERYISIPAKHTKEQYISKSNNSVTILR